MESHFPLLISFLYDVGQSDVQVEDSFESSRGMILLQDRTWLWGIDFYMGTICRESVEYRCYFTSSTFLVHINKQQLNIFMCFWKAKIDHLIFSVIGDTTNII